VLRASSYSIHASANTPAEPLGAVTLSPSDGGLPAAPTRSASAVQFFEACSAFTQIPACMLAWSPFCDRCRGLQPLRYLHDCFDCFRLQWPVAGWDSHPLEDAALSRRTGAWI